MKKNSKYYKIWKDNILKSKCREYNFDTISSMPNDLLYSPSEENEDFLKNINYPGEFPYTRGIHSNMYRGKLWTMRQFAGFGSPEETNQRFKFLLNNGITGLSVAFDMPTLMGYDCDNEISDGEVGHCGVSISSLKDMEVLFDEIDLSKVSVSMTINGPAVIIFAFYVALAKKKDINLNDIRGTLQNDILKEYIAQKEWIYPPNESMRIIVDMIEYCTDKMPNYNTISISGYHIREAGSTAVQELAFTLANGFTYVEHCLERGLNIDDFAPRLSFFFNSHSDFFEEICKYRAARRIWARILKEKYNAKNEKSLKLKFHTQTAGYSLTAQQPENNITRTAYQALAAVLGGTQSLHTNSMDETLALPSEKAVEIALRTQQILAYETGVANVVDPLGGSWYIESLTDKIESECMEYFSEIETRGGVLNCIEDGFFQKEIADASKFYNDLIESNSRYVIGINKFIKIEEKIDIPILKISEEVQNKQISSINLLKKRRSNTKVQKALDAIDKGCLNNENLIPLIIDAALSYATLGEIVSTMKKHFGEWQEKAII